MQATGLLAACVQHEIDHLNGVLFIDHLSRLKRDMMMRKIAKDDLSAHLLNPEDVMAKKLHVLYLWEA